MKNLSKAKRDLLLEKIEEIKQNYIDDEQTIFLLNEIENELTEKKYGLVWEQHEERVDEQMKTKIPVFTEISEREIIGNPDSDNFNFLLEGDNLHSLKLLEKTHKNMIDLIYIDPPYNTGNKDDFMYNDEYVDKEDNFRHSKWISFMSERLEIAKKLLTPKGVIFIQINDIEVAQLKLLCDEIFGEENFLNLISVNMKNIAGASGGGEDKKFKKNCEYILVYTKNYDLLPLFNGSYKYTEMSELIQQYLDEGKSWKYTSVLVNQGKKEYIGSTVDGDGNEIKIYKRVGVETLSVNQIATRDGITLKDAYKKYGINVFRTTNAQTSIRTRVMDYRIENNISDEYLSIEYIPRTGKNKGVMYEQFYKGDVCNLFVWLRDTSEVIDGELFKKELQGTYWDFVGSTKNLSKEGNIEFPNGKKSIDLLKQIIGLYPQKDITVLDFFAGSGSTGHAVISQNIEDGGTRRFILCTNNEIQEEKRNAYLLDKKFVAVKKDIKAFVDTENFETIKQSDEYQELGIARSITYRRLQNVINGYTTDKGKVVEPQPANLKYYKTDFIDKISGDEDFFIEDALLEHIIEMVQLENGIKIDNNKYMVIFTDEEAEEFEANFDKYSPQVIYIDSTVFLSKSIMQKLEDANVEILTIPEYYFASDIKGVN